MLNVTGLTLVKAVNTQRGRVALGFRGDCGER